MSNSSSVQRIFVFLIWLSWMSFGCARMQSCEKNVTNSTNRRNVFNVMNFGAFGDGKTDDTQAFLEAWTEACSSTTNSVLRVPSKKSFLVYQVTFHGPCKSNRVTVQILGNIIAPRDLSEWKDIVKQYWILFDSVNNLKINGTGQINGQGSSWWECRRQNKCKEAPSTLIINHCDGFIMRGLHLIDSPRMHMRLSGLTGATISGIRITAPGDSPNTDGIHLQGCNQVNITNSNIGTGDDCISIGTKSSNVNITHVSCGPGHGISVGSLGRKGEPAAVENIYVSHCNFSNTTNGARIKTWPEGIGFARNITFKHITLKSTSNPVIIDQYYCNKGDKCPTKPSLVKLSNISFININGTSKSSAAIKLKCSKAVACKNIKLQDIHLQSTFSMKRAGTLCTNVAGLSSMNVTPPITCARG